MAWGAVDNFHSRLQDIVSAYTGSAGGITGTDSGAVQQFLIDGCYDVLEKIKVIDTGSVWEFCISTAFDNNNGQDFDENRDIIGVERNGYPARQVDFQIRHRLTDSDSIHYATEKDPVFYIGPDTSSNARKLYMLPAATGGEPGQVFYIPEYSLTAWNSSTSSINNFPKKFYDHVTLYAAIRLLERNYIELVNQEEDLELAQGIAAGIQVLKQRYTEMFTKPDLGVAQ
jgi:hypothetical protein